jgi:hypothetical protein
LAIAAGVVGACSAIDNEDDSNSSAAGLNGSGNGSGGGLLTTGSAGSSTGGACAGEDFTADELPLDMYIMLDQSGSMSDANKWGAVTSALTQFVQSSDTVGIGVGLGYFPIATGTQCPLQCLSNAECGSCGPCFQPVPQIPGFCMNAGGDSCDINDYATPEVPIAVLPGVANAIVGSMSGHGPSGGTPTSAAIDGAITYARAYAQATPQHVVIAVLATDGDPTSCDTNLGNIQAIAANGVNGSPSIMTFVIGVGGSLSNLNAIAQAGGSGSAFLVDTNSNVTQQFIDALNQIKGAALGCTYSIPVPTMGNPDYDSVNVYYNGQPIPKVAGASACPTNGNGWYYDDPTNPTKITLCDATCATVTGDDTATVSIKLNCPSIVE